MTVSTPTVVSVERTREVLSSANESTTLFAFTVTAIVATIASLFFVSFTIRYAVPAATPYTLTALEPFLPDDAADNVPSATTNTFALEDSTL